MKDISEKILYAFIFVAVLFAIIFTFQTATNSNKKHFSDIKIVFFSGGPKGGAFSTIVYNGARAAQKDFGPKVEYMWSEWDTDKMVSQFKEAIEKRPDGICVMGHPGKELLRPLVSEAIRKGIIVTFQNVDVPDVRTRYIDKGFGYVGQAVFDSGLMLSRGLVKKYDLSPEDKAVVYGIDIKDAPARGMRTEGCVQGLEENGLNVQVSYMSDEAQNSMEKAREEIEYIFSMVPDLKVLVIDHGAVTAEIAKILKSLGKYPSEVFVAGFDLSAGAVQGIKEKYVGLVSDQQPYLQGYLPVLQVCMARKYGFSGLYVDTGVGLVDDHNIDLLADLAKKQIR